jgi:hypothetical protein
VGSVSMIISGMHHDGWDLVINFHHLNLSLE